MSTTTEMATALLNDMRGLRVDQMIAELGKRFPKVSRDEFDRAFGIAQEELQARAKMSFDEADYLGTMASMLDGLPKGTKFDEAVAIKAKQGNAFALQYLAMTNSKAYRVGTALFEAAIEVHPDWRRTQTGIKWIGDGPRPDSLDDSELVDWFQRNHPVKARDIQDAIEAA